MIGVETTTRSDYYVYLCRIAGKVVYVGKGCGYRMNRHWKTSHNPDLRAMIETAREEGLLVQFRKLTEGLTNLDALRLEARCFEKWRRTLVNRNNPYPALEAERDEAAWNAMYEAGEFDAFIVDEERLEALYAIDEGRMTRQEAIERGLLEPDDDEQRESSPA